MDFQKKSIYETEFCALDLETTGVNPFTDRIIEIGIIKFSLFKTKGKYESFVNPQCPIAENAINIHGITDKMVANAPTFDKLMNKIVRFIGNSYLVIQNPKFDISFLEMEFRRYGKRIPDWVSYDTVILSKKAYPELVNHKLNTLCEFFNIKLNHHRALSDTFGCMEVFKNIIKKIDPAKKWTFKELNEYHGKVDKTGLIKDLKYKRVKNRQLRIGVPVKIKYEDSAGHMSERDIVPKHIYKRGKQSFIMAYCLLRMEERVFKSDRIKEIEPLKEIVNK